MINDKFLRACRLQSNDTPPVWLMRQAGRYLPEYREIRKKGSMLSICQQPELVREITLQPLRRFDFDAAILFSDIVIPFLGFDVDFDLKEGVGPVVSNPLRSAEDVNRVAPFDIDEKLPFMARAIELLTSELGVPLLGFSGAPFTLAAYLIEGKPSRDFRFVRSFIHKEPAAWNRLATRLSEIIVMYLSSQVRAGAAGVQIFDSWVGVLDEATYRAQILPHMVNIFAQLKSLQVPLIHFSTATGHLLKAIAEIDFDVLGIDWRISLKEAADIVGSRAIQGNLDPAILLSSKEKIKQEVARILKQAEGIRGFIFNLGHGILPDTPIENVDYMLHCIRNPLMEL